MSLIPVTAEAFSGRHWLPHTRFDFARGRSVIELTAAELPHAACLLPVGFLPQDDGSYIPTALLGLDPTHNLFVARDGSWLGGYVPALFRASPFAFARTETGESVLCVDESLLPAKGEAGELFFTAQGEPSAKLLQVRDFLATVSSNRTATLAACAALKAAGLLRPWDIVVATQQGQRRLQGLFCIDEAALNQTDAATLHRLRECGALALAYCQLIAMQHIAKLGELADAHAKLKAAGDAVTGSAELNLDFLSRDGTLSFGNI